MSAIKPVPIAIPIYLCWTKFDDGFKVLNLSALEKFSSKSYNKLLYSSGSTSRCSTMISDFLGPPGPPLPRPVLPRERGYMDRVVEYLVGDGPSNRFALICRQCQSHNGMALREEFEYIGKLHSLVLLFYGLKGRVCQATQQLLDSLKVCYIRLKGWIRFKLPALDTICE